MKDSFVSRCKNCLKEEIYAVIQIYVYICVHQQKSEKDEEISIEGEEIEKKDRVSMRTFSSNSRICNCAKKSVTTGIGFAALTERKKIRIKRLDL